jgi:hypothetical protein
LIREKANIGIFITLADPRNPIKVESVKDGFYEPPFGKFPKLQIYTIQKLFSGTKPNSLGSIRPVSRRQPERCPISKMS